MESNPIQLKASETRMSHPAFLLDACARETVLQSIKDVCTHRNWLLLAAHVRTNHVHIILEATTNTTPDRMLIDFKSYSTRALNQQSPGTTQKHWSRHGSTRYLWKDQDVQDATRYVIEDQGTPMAMYLSEPRP